MAVREYVGARYVPIFVGEWDSTMQTTYEPLSIVSVANVGSYTSKKFVPVGISITDSEYWALTASTSGQITQLTQRVDDLKDRVDDMAAIVKTPEGYGAAGDGVTDDTAAINNALSGGGYLLFSPDATYLVDPEIGLLVDNNSYVNLNGATIKAKSSSAAYYEVFHINKKKNVTICNGVVKGERDTHTGSGGEWGMCVYIGGSDNVLIDNLDVSDAWGDGVYVGDTKTYENIKCTHIRINNCRINNCRRQGISVTFAEDVIISNNLITNTHGTAPEGGIDVEPNANLSVKRIIITDNILVDNMYGVVCSGGASGAKVEDVIISDNIIKTANGTRIIQISSCDHIKIDSNEISNTTTSGSLLYMSLATDLSITGNKITDSTSGQTAIILAVDECDFTGNSFTNISVTTGEFLYVLSGSKNTICANSFIGITTSATEYIIYMAQGTANIIRNNTILLANTLYAIALGNSANSNHFINNMIYGTYSYAIYSRTPSSSANGAYFNDIQNGSGGAIGGSSGFTGTSAANVIDNAFVA